MKENANRAEAERLLGIADKLLQGKDLAGARDFAILAQDTEPLLDGSDRILAVADVLLAAENRINNHRDWYSILNVDRRSDDLDLIKKQYRRLAILLHPDKNRFAFADSAFKLVADAWAVLSEPAKKSLYDNELTLFSRIDLANDQKKLPVRRSVSTKSMDEKSRVSSFWTACPYCYNLYEYPRIYEDCCLRCQKCQRAFQAVEIPALPPLAAGTDAYYCCWAFFPVGFANSNSNSNSESAKNREFHNSMPPVIPADVSPVNGGGNGAPGDRISKKRGRPKKNLQA